jgi:hypothetical protein
MHNFTYIDRHTHIHAKGLTKQSCPADYLHTWIGCINGLSRAHFTYTHIHVHIYRLPAQNTLLHVGTSLTSYKHIHTTHAHIPIHAYAHINKCTYATNALIHSYIQKDCWYRVAHILTWPTNLTQVHMHTYTHDTAPGIGTSSTPFGDRYFKSSVIAL